MVCINQCWKPLRQRDREEGLRPARMSNSAEASSDGAQNDWFEVQHLIKGPEVTHFPLMITVLRPHSYSSTTSLSKFLLILMCVAVISTRDTR